MIRRKEENCIPGAKMWNCVPLRCIWKIISYWGSLLKGKGRCGGDRTGEVAGLSYWKALPGLCVSNCRDQGWGLHRMLTSFGEVVSHPKSQ